jgi:hypothetical protein
MHDSALPPADVVRRCADAMVAVLEEAGVGLAARA